MRKQIVIKNINQIKTDFGCKVTFGLSIFGNDYDLKYTITGVHCVPERADAVTVAFLYYAILHDMDIISEIPISEQLYYSITRDIIPQVVCCDKKAHDIKIIMPTTCEVIENQKRRGTGLSMGVDSFTTLHEYNDDALSDNYKLTDLVHLKTGAHHGMVGRFDAEVENRLFKTENDKVKAYCDKYGYNLITIETNLFEITCANFGWNFDTTHILRNLGSVMLLQNYFDKYYYASAINLDDFYININKDVAHSEKWLVPLLSNENIKFYSANSAMNRIEKTEYITRFSDTYDYLHVCWREEKNCGKCDKCIRSLVTLDALGKLDLYANAFDLQEYRKNRWKYIKRITALKFKNSFFQDIYNLLKEKNIKTPNIFQTSCTFLSIAVPMGIHIVKRKLFKRSKK